MENVTKINDELTVATGQVTAEQLQQAADEGFKSVINLRSPDEEDFVSEEALQVEAVGLHYLNIPIKAETIADELTDLVIQRIDEVPKPALIHCKSGMRSGTLTMIYVALEQGLAPQEAFEKAHQIGLNCSVHPQMKQFFENYVSAHQGK